MENVTVVPAIRADRVIKGKVNVILRVMVRRKVAKTLSTGIRIDPDNWDTEARQVINREPNAKLYNLKISREVSRLQEEFLTKELLNIPLTRQRVKRIAEGKDFTRDFYEFCLGKDTDGVRKAGWLDQKYSNKETIRTYKGEVTKLKEYSPTLSFGDIDYSFLTNYKKYLEEVRQNEPNTIFKTFKFINTMMNDALKMGGIIERNPFADFNRGKYEDPNKLGITVEECDRIREVINQHEGALKWVAAKFLLMCYAGLRFEDAMRYDPDIHSINGTRIEIKTQKKGVHLNMKVYARLADVIQLLRELPKMIMTNKEYNKWLKVLANLAKVITVPLSAHVGRHTFGEILAEMEVPEEQAQRLLAHKDKRSTRVYYKVKDKALDRAIDKLNYL